MPALRILARGDPNGSVLLKREQLVALLALAPADPPSEAAAEPYRYDPERDLPVYPPVGFDAAGRPCVW